MKKVFLMLTLLAGISLSACNSNPSYSSEEFNYDPSTETPGQKEAFDQKLADAPMVKVVEVTRELLTDETYTSPTGRQLNEEAVTIKLSDGKKVHVKSSRFIDSRSAQVNDEVWYVKNDKGQTVRLKVRSNE